MQEFRVSVFLMFYCFFFFFLLLQESPEGILVRNQFPRPSQLSHVWNSADLTQTNKRMQLIRSHELSSQRTWTLTFNCTSLRLPATLQAWICRSRRGASVYLMHPSQWLRQSIPPLNSGHQHLFKVQLVMKYWAFHLLSLPQSSHSCLTINLQPMIACTWSLHLFLK